MARRVLSLGLALWMAGCQLLFPTVVVDDDASTPDAASDVANADASSDASGEEMATDGPWDVADGSADADVVNIPPGVACADASCNKVGWACCAVGASPYTFTCEVQTTCASEGGITIRCDQSADCNGQVCCFRDTFSTSAAGCFNFNDGGSGGCPAGGLERACNRLNGDNDCLPGQTCTGTVNYLPGYSYCVP